jgi:hypothetical protein
MSASVLSKSVSPQALGAQVISKTLDYMHSRHGSPGDRDYEFQKDVLAAAYTGKGTIINLIA